MESLDDSKLSSKVGFFKHVFNFDDDSKAEIFNIIQYSLIAFVPIVFLNKAMQKFVPEADEEKGSFELLAEVIIQIIVMFIGIFYINRIVTYLPTYSGTKYPDFNVTYVILSVLVITMSLQTKLGEKVSILVDRVMDLWNGSTDDKKKGKGKGKGNVKVTQPFSGMAQTASDSATMGNSLYGAMSQGTTSISSLPNGMATKEVKQNAPDYNAMYRNDSTPLQDAQTPGGGMIMAANEVLGGSGFGSNW
jgi:hypothetical protein